MVAPIPGAPIFTPPLAPDSARRLMYRELGYLGETEKRRTYPLPYGALLQMSGFPILLPAPPSQRRYLDEGDGAGS